MTREKRPQGGFFVELLRMAPVHFRHLTNHQNQIIGRRGKRAAVQTRRRAPP